MPQHLLVSFVSRHRIDRGKSGVRITVPGDTQFEIKSQVTENGTQQVAIYRPTKPEC